MKIFLSGKRLWIFLGAPYLQLLRRERSCVVYMLLSWYDKSNAAYHGANIREVSPRMLIFGWNGFIIHEGSFLVSLHQLRSHWVEIGKFLTLHCFPFSKTICSKNVVRLEQSVKWYDILVCDQPAAQNFPVTYVVKGVVAIQSNYLLDSNSSSSFRLHNDDFGTLQSGALDK